jgi:hypothetical protein
VDELYGFRETLAAVVAEGGSDAPRRICELCVVALPVSGAAITVMADADRQSLICASDDVSTRIDELQFRLVEGPCVDAFASGRPVLIADISDTGDSRWPVFAAAVARETPARGMFVWPLSAGEVRIGVLDFYRDRPGLLDAAAVARAEQAADAAFWSLLGTRRGHTLDARGNPVDDALDLEDDALGPLADASLERREVYQATGMLIAQLGLAPAAALARLRAHAFLHDRTVDEVARDIVARRLRFDPGRT